MAKVTELEAALPTAVLRPPTCSVGHPHRLLQAYT